jgi:hypothetical protein
MNTFMERNEEPKFKVHETICPYNGINVCMASLSSMAINSWNREKYCGNENYDNCPLFLSKVLRRR